MKTTLPTAITTKEEATAFLLELQKNGESYHPEGDANDIIWHDLTDPPTVDECHQLNKLMSHIYALGVDPCEVLMELYMRQFTVDGEQCSLMEILAENPAEDIVGIEEMQVGDESYFEGIVLIKRIS